MAGFGSFFFERRLSLIRLGFAGPGARALEERTARAVVERSADELEDRSLQGQGDAQLQPGGLPVLRLGRLLVVEAPPDELEDLRTDEAGQKPAGDREGCEEDSRSEEHTSELQSP